MTLIKINDNPFTDPIRKWKNPYWEARGETPNEAMEHDPQYRQMVTQFARHNKVSGPFRFFEVRVVSDSPSVIYDKAMKWWTHKDLMDRVFWMFQKPRYDLQEGKEPYGYYTLEPFECSRVWQVGCKTLGVPIPNKMSMRNAFTIPIECCQLAWTETSNGFSDHLHHRPEIVKSQFDLDREQAIKAASAKIIAAGQDINSSAAFKNVKDDAVAKAVKSL